MTWENQTILAQETKTYILNVEESTQIAGSLTCYLDDNNVFSMQWHDLFEQKLTKESQKKVRSGELPDGYEPRVDDLKWQHPSALLPFGSASRSAVFTFSDLDFQAGAEICGKMAVGGNLNIESIMINLGFVPSHIGNGDEMPYTKNEVRYLINGNASGNISEVNGWLAVGGNCQELQATLSLADGGYKISGNANGLVTTQRVLQGNDTFDDDSNVKDRLTQYFQDAQNDLQKLNESLFAISSDGTIKKEGNQLYLTGQKQYNVFSIDVAMLNDIKELYIQVPQNVKV